MTCPSKRPYIGGRTWYIPVKQIINYPLESYHSTAQFPFDYGNEKYIWLDAYKLWMFQPFSLLANGRWWLRQFQLRCNSSTIHSYCQKMSKGCPITSSTCLNHLQFHTSQGQSQMFSNNRYQKLQIRTLKKFTSPGFFFTAYKKTSLAPENWETTSLYGKLTIATPVYSQSRLFYLEMFSIHCWRLLKIFIQQSIIP